MFSGKGQFICGNLKCEERIGLKSYEINFAYLEEGEKKNALVKLRVCPSCASKLNFHRQRKEVEDEDHTNVQLERKGNKEARKRKRESNEKPEEKEKKRKELESKEEQEEFKEFIKT